VSTYRADYQWDLTDYLADISPQQIIEMHVLSQSTIFDLAARFGCVPLEVLPDSSTGIPGGISNTCY
jgi:hypothetical protein